MKLEKKEPSPKTTDDLSLGEVVSNLAFSVNAFGGESATAKVFDRIFRERIEAIIMEKIKDSINLDPELVVDSLSHKELHAQIVKLSAKKKAMMRLLRIARYKASAEGNL